MLLFIRNKMTGIVAWGVVLLITIPFALWGVGEYVTPNQDAVLAEIEGTELRYSDFRIAYSRARQNYPNASSEQLTALRRNTLGQMVMFAVLDHSAAALGLRADDAVLAEAIRDAFFQGEVELTREQYIEFLQRQGFTPERYEEDLRRQLSRQQLVDGIAQSAVVTDTELSDAARRDLQRRQFSVLSFLPLNYSGDEPEQEVIAAFFKENRKDFVIPEQLQVEYLLLSRDDIAAGIEISEDSLRVLYEDQKLNYTELEHIEVSHILLSVPTDADATAWDEAMRKAEELKAVLDQGADFAALAKEYSNDYGSAINGGELGVFGRGIMAPAFDEAAFSLSVGKVSAPVRTEFGVHLIKTTEHVKSRVSSFASVRDQLRQEIIDRETDKIYFEQADQLTNLAYENPESLEYAAQQMTFPLQHSGWFSRNAKGNDADVDEALFYAPEVLSAAFNKDAIASREASALIELDGQRTLVLRVINHRKPRQQSLKEVQEEIIEHLIFESAAAKSRAAAKEILAALRHGVTAEAAARIVDLAWVTYEAQERDSDVTDNLLLQSVFKAPALTADRPFYGGIDVSDGGYRLFAVTRIEDRELDDIDAADRSELELALFSDYGRNAFIALQIGRRNAYEVYISDSSLEEQ